MAFYVSAIDDHERKALVCGPFRTHGAALRKVFIASQQAKRLFKDADHFRTSYGTCQHKASHHTTAAIRAINDALVLDEQGYVVA